MRRRYSDQAEAEINRGKGMEDSGLIKGSAFAEKLIVSRKGRGNERENKEDCYKRQNTLTLRYSFHKEIIRR